jgi:hypothetical protein
MTPGVLSVLTDDGVSLAVIDVTHPAFAMATNDTELEAMSHQFVLESRQRQEIPAALRDALRTSMLGRGLTEASGTFLSGMSTYLLKLGPDNLGTEAGPLDRRIAASFPALVTRLRLQDMARLLADGLRPAATARPRRPLALVNIGGGPAADSWNALLHLHAEDPDLLAGRTIAIVVLDQDVQGPAFGGRAVEMLRTPGAPLGGLEIGFRHVSYQWSDVNRLRQALDDLRAAETACAISSEGALFEYGSDTDIVTNLQALHAGTAPDAIVVASVTRDDEPVRSLSATDRAATRPRTLDAFRSLADHAEWSVRDVIERPFSFNVRLVKR